MRRPLLVAFVVALAAAPSARADLVQLDGAREQAGIALARSAGGKQLAPELRLWRVPASSVQHLREAGVVRFSAGERLLPTTGLLQSSDPLVSLEWWINAVGADRADPPGPGKPVTIVDSGLDASHPEFAGRPDTTLLNAQTTDAPDEDHGTEVGSVIAAPQNGFGLVGIYPQAVFRSWDASPFGFIAEGSAIEGIVEAARHGPGVINLSFGGGDRDPLLEEAILYAFRSGSLVVAASGNEGLEGSPTGFPASFPHVLTVGATAENGFIAPFSTRGPMLDLAAPGVSIPVAEPTAETASGYLNAASGTSFSAPIVSGAAAWVWTTRPELDNTQLFEIMRRSARDILTKGYDLNSGYGALDIPAALAYPVPFRDPLEPNDDAGEIEPNRVFDAGLPPVTRPGQLAASLRARVDRHEDPIDLYRIWAPAAMTVTARTTGTVSLRLLPRSRAGIRGRPLATGTRATLSYRNTGRSRYIYVEVRPETKVRIADYTLRLTAARR